MPCSAFNARPLTDADAGGVPLPKILEEYVSAPHAKQHQPNA
jgi:hypothetical protein